MVWMFSLSSRLSEIREVLYEEDSDHSDLRRDKKKAEATLIALSKFMGELSRQEWIRDKRMDEFHGSLLRQEVDIKRLIKGMNWLRNSRPEDGKDPLIFKLKNQIKSDGETIINISQRLKVTADLLENEITRNEGMEMDIITFKESSSDFHLIDEYTRDIIRSMGMPFVRHIKSDHQS